MKLYNILLIFLITFLFQDCNSPSDISKEESHTDILDTVLEKNEEEMILVDSFQTSIANLISCKDGTYFDTIGDVNFANWWKSLSDEIDVDYTGLKTDRLNKMKEWSSDGFIQDNDTSLVFYPFSGPDFLHVYYLYPNANEYILLAREEIGSLPYEGNVWTSAPKETKKLVDRTYYFLRDVILKSFFLTNNMKSHVREGDEILLSLYWFLSRTEHNIVGVDRVTIDENGKILIRQEEGQGIDGVRFHFIKEGETKVKKLTYFACDISDGGFKNKNPNLLVYLKNIRECNTFTKAASYLMHYSFFHEIRDVVLEKSITIFQDDTGIPYKYFNNDNWTVRHFGAYVKPPSNFAEDYDILYQQDLVALYKSQASEKLPFSLGYHWVSSLQNQMFITRSSKE